MARPTLYNQDILDKTDAYIQQCVDTEYIFQKMSGKTDGFEEKVKVNLPSVIGLALFLDVNADTIYEWEKLHDEFSVKVTRVRNLQHERLMTGGLSGRYNPLIAKLLLSSAHGYREGKDITTNGKDLPSPIVDLTKLPAPKVHNEPSIGIQDDTDTD